MKAQSTKGLLRLEVRDFGPIVKGKLDLRPLTVFVGPSNTGKSWLAILIYSLHRHFSDTRLRRAGRPLGARRGLMHKGISLSQADYLGVAEWLEQAISETHLRELFGTASAQRTENKSISVPQPIRELLQSTLDAQGRSLCHELRRCFGIDLTRLTRNGSSSNARIVFGTLKSNETDEFENKLTLVPKMQRLSTALSEDVELSMVTQDIREPYFDEFLYTLDTILSKLRRDVGSVSDFWFNRLLASFVELALPSIVGDLHVPAFYLPADRTGVMHAHSVVVNALIESAALTGLRPVARRPVLSGVLADFLEQLIELDSHTFRETNSSNDYAARIEKAILRGSIQMERAQTSGYPRFTYEPDGWNVGLPLMNASSMVSELAPVVLYLRYRVASHNVIIVEEPESHLHPAMQVELTRQLAALIQAGIRVIITTHSEWVLEELANIIRKSSLSQSQTASVSNSQTRLHADQVGVWLFTPSNRADGSTIEQIPLDDSGLFPSGFDEVAIALHNDWAEISSYLDSDK